MICGLTFLVSEMFVNYQNQISIARYTRAWADLLNVLNFTQPRFQLTKNVRQKEGRGSASEEEMPQKKMKWPKIR